MFTLNHFIWLGICAVIIAGLLIASLKFKFSFKTATYIMSGVSIASELTKIFSHMKTPPLLDGKVLLAKSLPLHLCSILIFMFFYLALSKNKERIEKVKSFVVPICLIAGFMALIMATSGTSFTDPSSYQSFIYHACIFWYGLYLICTKQVKLGLKEYLMDCVYLLCLVIVMIWVNSALQNYDVNFFFLVEPPADNLPILNLNHGWYVYFLSLVATGLVTTFFVHLPSIIKEIKLKKEM